MEEQEKSEMRSDIAKARDALRIVINGPLIIRRYGRENEGEIIAKLLADSWVTINRVLKPCDFILSDDEASLKKDLRLINSLMEDVMQKIICEARKPTIVSRMEVKVQRSNGAIESGWVVYNRNYSNGVVEVRDKKMNFINKFRSMN